MPGTGGIVAINAEPRWTFILLSTMDSFLESKTSQIHAEVKGKANQVITNSTQCTNAARSKLTDWKTNIGEPCQNSPTAEDGLKTSAHQAIL